MIVKDIDTKPVTDEIRHISFFEIDETREMVFSIPFNIVGISPAVKNNLGVLVQVMPSLEVKCKVKDLIPHIEVDVSSLEHPGQTITVSDLHIPENISFVNDDIKNATAVTITEMQEEEIVETTPEEEVATEGEATEAQAPAEGVQEEAKKEE